LACAAINGSTGTKVPVFDVGSTSLCRSPVVAAYSFTATPQCHFAYQLKTGAVLGALPIEVLLPRQSFEVSIKGISCVVGCLVVGRCSLVFYMHSFVFFAVG
jgi:hypothetical protein